MLSSLKHKEEWGGVPAPNVDAYAEAAVQDTPTTWGSEQNNLSWFRTRALRPSYSIFFFSYFTSYLSLPFLPFLTENKKLSSSYVFFLLKITEV